VLRTAAVVAPLTVEVTGVATHPEDDFILATAVARGASYLVTDDRKLRAIAAFQAVTILIPREFLARLECEASA
jgi:predicted nucleic acid-binding protein